MSSATASNKPLVLRPAPDSGSLDTAVWALGEGFWPVALYAPGDDLGEGRVADGKQPIRNAWGRAMPTLESLRADFAGHRGRGVGLRLGPTGKWSDVEGDGPEWAGQFASLCGGEVVETLGWDSRRGGHNMTLPPPPELAMIPSGFKAPWSEYSDLEFRLNGKDSQSQSVIPPTTTDGFSRAWRGPWNVAPLPEAAVRELVKLWEEDKRRKRAATSDGGRSKAKRAKEGAGAVSTIDQWNQEQGRDGILAMLESHGWQLVKTGADNVLYVRHPSATGVWSGSIGWCGDRLYVWSNNTAFPVGKTHDAFDVYRILEHGDDFRGALTSLRERGYGRGERSSSGSNGKAPVESNGHHTGGLVEAPVEEPSVEPTVEAGESLTDIGNSTRFARDHAGEVRYVGGWGRWIVYDGQRWTDDETGKVYRLARSTVRGIAAEAADIGDSDRFKATMQWAIKSEDARKLGAMIQLARSESALAVSHRALNADPWILNVSNGTIDLKTGRLRPHAREDLVTHLAPVAFDPEAKCPLWEYEMETVFAGDRKLIAFFRRLVGYWITGVVREQILPIAFGKGRNGKTTVLTTLLRIFGGDYSYEADPALIMQKSSNDHPTERAALFGKRLVSLSETDSGKRLNEALVKRLTGKEQITARRMREDPWSFWPSHKLILSTNHRPEIMGTDVAIWRRVLLIPFTTTIDPKDEITDFAVRLEAEDSGILAWAVRGCLEWQEQGLSPPESVIAATRDYRDSQDSLAAFVAERCLESPSVRERSGEMYKNYCEWSKENGEETLGSRTFYEALADRGFPSKIGSGNRRFLHGIGLRKDPP